MKPYVWGLALVCSTVEVDVIENLICNRFAKEGKLVKLHKQYDLVSGVAVFEIVSTDVITQSAIDEITDVLSSRKILYCTFENYSSQGPQSILVSVLKITDQNYNLDTTKMLASIQFNGGALNTHLEFKLGNGVYFFFITSFGLLPDQLVKHLTGLHARTPHKFITKVIHTLD